jgi:hypothetical protein
MSMAANDQPTKAEDLKMQARLDNQYRIKGVNAIFFPEYLLFYTTV